jgi:hypothetical protein
MNNVIHINFNAENVAPESDCVVLVESVTEAIDQFGHAEFAMTLAEAELLQQKAA